MEAEVVDIVPVWQGLQVVDCGVARPHFRRRKDLWTGWWQGAQEASWVVVQGWRVSKPAQNVILEDVVQTLLPAQAAKVPDGQVEQVVCASEAA